MLEVKIGKSVFFFVFFMKIKICKCIVGVHLKQSNNWTKCEFIPRHNGSSKLVSIFIPEKNILPYVDGLLSFAFVYFLSFIYISYQISFCEGIFKSVLLIVFFFIFLVMNTFHCTFALYILREIWKEIITIPKILLLYWYDD